MIKERSSQEVGGVRDQGPSTAARHSIVMHDAFCQLEQRLLKGNVVISAVSPTLLEVKQN